MQAKLLLEEVLYILRVISGSAKGSKLATPTGYKTRPTSDYVKEALFNIISSEIRDSNILDLYAGTGNLGIEALSRGARCCTFVDNSIICKTIIHRNLEHTKLRDKASVLKCLAKNALLQLGNEHCKFDIIFADPPYNSILVQDILSNILQNNIINNNGLVVIEHNVKHCGPQEVNYLQLEMQRDYGSTRLSFYRNSNKTLLHNIINQKEE